MVGGNLHLDAGDGVRAALVLHHARDLEARHHEIGIHLHAAKSNLQVRNYEYEEQ